MKLKKLLNKFSAVALSAVLVSSAAVPAFAVGVMPKGYIVDSVKDSSVAYQTENADMLYYIYRQILDYQTKIDISEYRIPYDQENFQAIYDALSGIFPELFYFDTTVFDSPTYFYSADFYMKELVMNYNKSQSEIKAMLDAFHEKADYYLSLVDDSMDEFTKALVLHDALVLNARYQIKSEGSETIDSTTYTFMVEGWGRCENYAECYAYLLAHVGIESEIVNSDSMNHEWMKIHLDGSDYYYNVDVTWDDPLFGGKDRPNKVAHTYFLLSDEAFQNHSKRNHYGYISNFESDAAYDGQENLHTIDHPFFFVDGKLYTLYRSGLEGRIATYDYEYDELTDVYTVTDKWYSASGGYWSSNYSDIGMYQGLLYFNRENSVDIFDPATGKTETYISNALSDGRKLYGMFIRDNVIYGLAANSPNDDAEQVELGFCKEVEPQYTQGDVNLDGVLDISDATMIQSFLAELTALNQKQLALADFNNDGDININDATDIQFAISR